MEFMGKLTNHLHFLWLLILFANYISINIYFLDIFQPFQNKSWLTYAKHANHPTLISSLDSEPLETVVLAFLAIYWI